MMMMSQRLRSAPSSACNKIHKPHALSSKQASFIGNRGFTIFRKNLRDSETLHVARSNNGQDFDSFLIDIANKFEKADNKGPLIGWTVASFFAITTVEWLIHLPLFDFLIGFPLQFLGIISAINLGLKYYVDKRGDPASDIKDIVESVAKQLPGIGK